VFTSANYLLSSIDGRFEVFGHGRGGMGFWTLYWGKVFTLIDMDRGVPETDPYILVNAIPFRTCYCNVPSVCCPYSYYNICFLGLLLCTDSLDFYRRHVKGNDSLNGRGIGL
jgi:hypothetical protein